MTMTMISIRRALLAGTAAAVFAAAPANAETSREAELEARLKMLEAAVAGLRADLAAAREAPQPRPVATAAAKSASPLPTPTPAPAKVATAAGTSVKLGGFVKSYAALSLYRDGAIPNNSTGRDFYVPGAIPVGGATEGASLDAHVKQSRLSLALETPIEGHSLKGLFEIDFQVSPGNGNQRVTNAYNPGLRRAFLSFDELLFGQEWTNFQYVAALPETTDFAGPGEGTVFARQVQLRYTRGIAEGVTLSVAAENPETMIVTAGGGTMGEAGDDRMPDLTARFNLATGIGEFSLAGIGRRLTNDIGSERDSAFGWGVSLAGKAPFGPGKRHDLRFMVTHGEGIGRYVGFNFAPDAVFAPGGDGQLDQVGLTAGFAALRLGWTDKLRSTFMGSVQSVDYPEGLAFGSWNRKAWSAAANLFYSPIRNVDVGIEVRHGERELVSGATGRLDRTEFAARYSF